MKEITFLKQNHQKWQEFEAMLNSGSGGKPDVLADLFVQLTDDLSYARTFYPNSNTEQYLNGLAARVHQEIYKNKKERRSRLVTFWTNEFPDLMGKQRGNLFLTFLIFAISVFVGVVSARHDETFVRVILGDGYVDMTLQNMLDNDPLGVYKSEHQFSMFLFIALNNARVALFCVLAGLIFCWVGVAFLQFKNGVMLGAFMYFLYDHGYGHEATLTVWIHGTIEIWCIIVSGAAGIALGRAVWFPGPWPWSESVKRGGREALKIGFALIPFIFLAAFFEGFVTRYTMMNDIGRWAIILSSLTFVLWYFVLLPMFREWRSKQFGPLAYLAKKHNNKLAQNVLKALSGDQRIAFMYLLGTVCIVLPSINLIMQIVTETKSESMTYWFFGLVVSIGVCCFIFGSIWVGRIEEKDLTIERKSTSNSADYERKARAVKA
ncbi:MAG: stage II sporulation protein M [Bacteroidia bacterium]